MSRYRILVVDDDEDLRSVLRITLKESFEVVEACDGLEALQKLTLAEPDFIILDVMMPLMDGFEACRAIRNHPGYRDVPVLFLSAKGDKEALKEGYTAGANLYLTKPIEPLHLIATVDYFLEQTGADPRRKRYAIGEIQAMKSFPTPALTDVARVSDAATARVPRVMIVDADYTLIETLTAELEGDFKVRFATDSIQAIERIIIHQPDLIVIDARLPGKSGFELCMSLRRNQQYGTAPIIFTSAKPSDRERDYCLQLGARHYLPKPFEPEALREKLLECTRSPEFAMRRRVATPEIHFPGAT